MKLVFYTLESDNPWTNALLCNDQINENVPIRHISRNADGNYRYITISYNYNDVPNLTEVNQISFNMCNVNASHVCEELNEHRNCIFRELIQIFTMGDTIDRCHKPDEPLNGYVTTRQTQDGLLATYHCNRGYVIAKGANNFNLCPNNSTWTEYEPPICTSMKNCSIERLPSELTGNLTELPANTTTELYAACTTNVYFTLHCSPFGELKSNVNIETINSDLMQVICARNKQSSNGNQANAQNTNIFQSNFAIAIYVISLSLIFVTFISILICCRRRYKRKLYNMILRNEIQMYTKQGCNFYGQNVIYPVQPYSLNELPISPMGDTDHVANRVRVLSSLANNPHFSSLSFKDDIYDDVTTHNY